MQPLGVRPPVAAGLDLDVPGVDVRLRATRWPGAGVPVLLLHGLASTRHIWDLVVPGLAGLPVVAIDQRGHGDSDRPEGPYDGDTVVRDVLLALDALGLSRVVVAGHSWGAWTALRLAAQAPERVLAVVALDGGVGPARRPDEPREVTRERMRPPATALPPDDLLARIRSGPLAPWWSDDVAACVLPLFAVGDDGLARARLPMQAHMAIVDDLLDVDAEAHLPDVRCPTWLVSCSPTPERRLALDRTAGRLARPRAQIWDGALHDVPLQWPALVAGLVRAAADEAASGLGGDRGAP